MSDLSIELIYEQTCPNVDAARALIASACKRLDRPVDWCEWEVSDPQLPEHARGFGSPTILVGGRDVAEALPGVSACCRIYSSAQGTQGVPTLEQVIQALKGSA